MKLYLACLAWCAYSVNAAYMSRMAIMNRGGVRTPSAFRPGVTLQRPWVTHRIMTATRRTPYVLYRTPLQRFVKPFQPGTRGVIFNTGGWKTTAQMPLPPSTPQTQDFIQSASVTSPLRIQSDGGAIHTIPAPNLSLAEKPIVVLEATDNLLTSNPVSVETPKRTTYEVTEKHIDPSTLLGTKVLEAPVGFRKPAVSQPDLSALVRNNVALQLASEYGLSAIALPPHATLVSGQQTILPVQNIQIPTSLHTPGVDSIYIPPSALYQHDQQFLQKLQNQLLERFPAVEYVPYHTNQGPVPLHQPLTSQPQQFNKPTPVPVYQPDKVTHHQQLAVLPIDDKRKNVVREAQEVVITTLPLRSNLTESIIETVTVSQPQNATDRPVEVQTSPTTTESYVNGSTVDKVTPIYYAQIGDTVGDSIASGIYSALNDVRAAVALSQVSNTSELQAEMQNTTISAISTTSSTTTTTMNPDLKNYFVQNIDKDENNKTITDIKPLLGVPFTKPDGVKVSYSIIGANDKEKKPTKDGSVYAGQIVEASISEDLDFDKEKESLLTRKPPVRIIAEKISITTTSTTTPKAHVVKARIPPKSKLTFDEKTGEPILRIYASYLDSPVQKEIVTSKLSNSKQVKDLHHKKNDNSEWKNGIRSLERQVSGDMSKVTQFGLKLRSRMDDIIPIFEDY